MPSREDIEAYIRRSELGYREVDEQTWIVRTDSKVENIVVRLEDPLVLFRVRVMELEGVRDFAGLFRKLLELNTAEIVHGAYGISDDSVMITGALVLESLDYGEFQRTIDDIALAISNHYETLASFRSV